jgi:hypothetical protein
MTSYLQSIIPDETPPVALPHPLMTLIANMDNTVSLKQLAFATKLLEVSSIKEMPTVLHALIQANRCLFTVPTTTDMSTLPLLQRHQVLTHYAVLQYLLRRACVAHYQAKAFGPWDSKPPLHWEVVGNNNAILFLQKANACKKNTEFLVLLHQLLSQRHISGDERSFRAALLTHLCREADFFVTSLKVDAELCTDGFPTAIERNYRNLEPLVSCCLRLIQIQINPEEESVFKIYLKKLNSPRELEQLRVTLNRATRNYFQFNCLVGTASKDGFERAKTAWLEFIACDSLESAGKYIATLLGKGQLSPYNDHSYHYLIACVLIQNPILCTHYNISETTKALTNKNALVEAVSAALCKRLGITVEKEGVSSQIMSMFSRFTK